METVDLASTHVSVPSGRRYEEVVERLESVLGGSDSKGFALRVGTTGTWEEFERKTKEAVGDSGFEVFAVVDHGGWMARDGHRMKGKMYVIGNPLVAVGMLRHAPEVGLYVPVRVTSTRTIRAPPASTTTGSRRSSSASATKR